MLSSRRAERRTKASSSDFEEADADSAFAASVRPYGSRCGTVVAPLPFAHFETPKVCGSVTCSQSATSRGRSSKDSARAARAAPRATACRTEKRKKVELQSRLIKNLDLLAAHAGSRLGMGICLGEVLTCQSRVGKIGPEIRRWGSPRNRPAAFCPLGFGRQSLAEVHGLDLARVTGSATRDPKASTSPKHAVSNGTDVRPNMSSSVQFRPFPRRPLLTFVPCCRPAAAWSRVPKGWIGIDRGRRARSWERGLGRLRRAGFISGISATRQNLRKGSGRTLRRGSTTKPRW